MTPEQLDELERVGKQATAGPWGMWGMDVRAPLPGREFGNMKDSQLICQTFDEERGLRTFNGNFISAARNNWQALIDECRKLRDIVRDIDFFWNQRQSGIAHEAYQDGKGLDDWSPTVELYKRVRDVMTEEKVATGRGRE